MSWLWNYTPQGIDGTLVESSFKYIESNSHRIYMACVHRYVGKKGEQLWTAAQSLWIGQTFYSVALDSCLISIG